MLVMTVAAAAAAGCAQPSSVELFVPASRAVDGVYSFGVDMSDSLAVYDLAFFTRVDRPGARRSLTRPAIRLDLEWVSPGGEKSGETVYMPSGDEKGVLQSYRRGVRPSEAGVWTLNAEVVQPEDGFRGLGIICKRNGTR